jgi:hypothetical protein
MASPVDLSPQALGGLIAHPRFAEAARALYRGKVETVEADKVMASLFRDAGHYVVALSAFSLHRDAGITLPRLKAVCAQSRLMSPGRTRALLGYLLHVGYLSRVSARKGAGAAVYAATPRFVAAWCRHMRSGLEAAAVLAPDAQALLAQTLLQRMDDPAVALGFAHAQGDIMLAALSHQDDALHALPFVRIFQHRLGGGRAVNVLISRDEGPGPLGAAPVPFAIDDLAGRCGISRVQARRLFDDAQAENLVRIEGGRLTWQPETLGFLAYSTAFELAALLASAGALAGVFGSVVTDDA